MGREHLGQEAGRPGDAGVVAGEAGGELDDATHADAVVVAAGEHAGAGGRAQRRGVEVGVPQAALGQGVERRRGDVGAEATQLGEAHVVEQDDDDVRCSRRRFRHRWPERLGIPVVGGDGAAELVRLHVSLPTRPSRPRPDPSSDMTLASGFAKLRSWKLAPPPGSGSTRITSPCATPCGGGRAERDPLTDARAVLDADDEGLPAWWGELGDLGWLGLHVAESDGGSGYGLLELAVVLEELGRACTPGAFLPTVMASAAIARFGTGPGTRAMLSDLVRGAGRAGLGLGCAPVAVSVADDGLRIDGTWGVVFGAGSATVLVLPVSSADDGSSRWVVVRADEVVVEALPGVDRTRRPARVTAGSLRLDEDRVLDLPGGCRRHRGHRRAPRRGRSGGGGVLVRGHRGRARPRPRAVR